MFFRTRVTEQNVIKDEGARRFVQEYTWTELPIDLYMSMGSDHEKVEPVGKIMEMWKQDDVVYATGVMRDDEQPITIEAKSRLEAGVQRFVSMVPRTSSDPIPQVLDGGEWVDLPNDVFTPEGMEYRLFIETVKIARVDMVSIPANESSVIEQWDGTNWLITDKFPARFNDEQKLELLSASGRITRYPKHFVEKQKYDKPTALRFIEENGQIRLTGHYTMWDSCHRGFARCKTPPKNALLIDERGHGWGSKTMMHEDGSVTKNVGPITIGRHVDGQKVNSFEELLSRLEDVTTQVGWCAYYEDAFGIQLQGVLASDLSESDITRLTMSRPSAVWATKNGRTIVAAITMVNDEGFDQGFKENVSGGLDILLGEDVMGSVEKSCCASCTGGGTCDAKKSSVLLRAKVRKRQKEKSVEKVVDNS